MSCYAAWTASSWHTSWPGSWCCSPSSERAVAVEEPRAVAVEEPKVPHKHELPIDLHDVHNCDTISASASTTCSSTCGDIDSSSDSAQGSAFSAEETLLIFDWDDTVLPSSWIKQHGLQVSSDNDLTPYQAKQLEQLTERAIRTMLAAKHLGTVIIVTNSTEGWVELSCLKFMPALANVLQGVRIISARSEYEKAGIKCPLEWKAQAFRKEVGRMDSGLRNIICLGDSTHEHAALFLVARGLPHVRAKSLHFLAFPEVSQLIEQHDLLLECLDDVVDHDGPLNLQVLTPR
eukprot:CAMPEP_0172701664 /NCGR_PEP_ID=MMETSP1074-20121228/31797_1 /TAXON_ID=2916 /ORGANISM="Ceratium fusus, Strain PA161109" /LENGTH=289 /DNA_ID=CAMNT_0013523239 /DNA_START=35 /DNA_END=904 /DNA_ORIENTATION=-